jgi:lipoprotein-releasing system ATP-binding protein
MGEMKREIPLVPTLRTENLSKSYFLGEVEVPVLEEINISLSEGEQVAVVGPSGVGKSTLLHLLGALDRPTRGEIFVDDHSLTRMSSDELAGFRNTRVGFVFQFHHLLPEFTAIENVLMPARLLGDGESPEIVARAAKLLENVGLSHRQHHRPGELSGGECLRVAVARALINKPGILIADEPTGNLDGEAAASLQRLLEDLAREYKATLIVATHNVAFAESLGRIIRLHDGTVEE